MIVAAAMVGLMAGCRHTATLPEELADLRIGHAGHPQIGLVYYPYGPGEARDLARPHPDFVGWTDQAMRVALNRIRGLGVDMLLVNADIRETPVDPARLERYRQFAAQADSAGQRIALYADATGITEAELRAFLNWMAELGWHTSTASWKDEQRPVVVIANGRHLEEIRQAGLVVIHWAWDRPVEFAAMGELAGTSLDREAGAVRILAADARIEASGEVEWRLPRRGGKSLRSAMAGVALLQPRFLVIESWNNYRDGSFIEPNSLDSTRLSDALERAISELKVEAVQGTADR